MVAFLEVTITSSDRHQKKLQIFFCFLFAILAILHHLETIFQFLFFSLVTVTRSNEQMVAFLNSNVTKIVTVTRCSDRHYFLLTKRWQKPLVTRTFFTSAKQFSYKLVHERQLEFFISFWAPSQNSSDVFQTWLNTHCAATHAQCVAVCCSRNKLHTEQFPYRKFRVSL